MTECSISKYSSFKKNGRNNQRAKQKCVHRIDGKLQWHQVATLPKSQDIGTSGCVRGSSGKRGVPTDPGGGEPLRRASRFVLVSIVSQSEVSSWSWDRSCSTQQQMGTRHPCGSERAWAVWPPNSWNQPTSFPSARGSPQWSSTQTEWDAKKRGKKNREQIHRYF